MFWTDKHDIDKLQDPKRKQIRYNATVRDEWLQKYPVFSREGNHHVKCESCQCIINVKRGSIKQLEAHLGTKKHKSSTSAISHNQKIDQLVFTDHQRKVISAELKFCYFLAKNNHAFSAADEFNSMVASLFPDSKIANKYACGRTKATTLIRTVLAPQINKEFLSNCSDRPYSVLLDETTDCSTQKQLAVLIRFVDDRSAALEICTKVVDLAVVNKATGENLFNALMTTLAANGLNISNMIGMASDSASNMIGRNNSCYSRVKAANPNVFLVKCVCHIAATCSNDAAKQLPDKLETFVSDIWAYFTHSASRLEDLEEFNCFLDDSTSPRRLLKPCQTRWLSLESCVARVLDQWGRLESFFKSRDDSKGKSLGKKFNPITKLYLLFIQESLPMFNKFNKFFQVWKRSLAFCMLLIVHCSCCLNLTLQFHWPSRCKRMCTMAYIASYGEYNI